MNIFDVDSNYLRTTQCHCILGKQVWVSFCKGLIWGQESMQELHTVKFVWVCLSFTRSFQRNPVNLAWNGERSHRWVYVISAWMATACLTFYIILAKKQSCSAVCHMVVPNQNGWMIWMWFADWHSALVFQVVYSVFCKSKSTVSGIIAGCHPSPISRTWARDAKVMHKQNLDYVLLDFVGWFRLPCSFLIHVCFLHIPLMQLGMAV